MGVFEIVIALLSFVYALALTHLFQSMSDLVVARRRVTFSWVHAAWMALALISLVNNWLGLIPLRAVAWSDRLILVQFATASVQYFTCSLVSPHVADEGPVSLKAYEAAQGRIYRAVYALMAVPLFFLNYRFGPEYFGHGQTFGAYLQHQWTYLAFTALLVVCIWARWRWLLIGVPVALSGYMLWGMLSQGLELG